MPFPDPKIQGMAVAWYPLIGGILGVFLALAASIINAVLNDWISAALVLTLWVWLTGALHIDGLADAADAWLGGLGSKSRTLKLMKDPTSGPIAIATVVLILFIKLACLQALFSAEHVAALIWSLIFARANAVLLIIHTPYVRESGLGSALRERLSAKTCYSVIALLALLSLFALGWLSLLILATSLVGLVSLRYVMLSRLNGFTGDTLGALIELSETLILLGLVAVIGSV